MYFYSFCCMSISQRRICCSIILANVQKTVWEVTNVQFPVISLKYNFNVKRIHYVVTKYKTFKTQIRHTSNTQIEVPVPKVSGHVFVSSRYQFCLCPRFYYILFMNCSDSVVFFVCFPLHSLFSTSFVVIHFIHCYSLHSLLFTLFIVIHCFLIKHGTDWLNCSVYIKILNVCATSVLF